VCRVEAARKTLFDEIAGIFGAYGIGVDSRHVSLISDSMMYSGDHRCMPSRALDSTSIPFCCSVLGPRVVFESKVALHRTIGIVERRLQQSGPCEAYRVGWRGMSAFLHCCRMLG